MAEGFPGYIPEASSESDDDDAEVVEKKTSKKFEGTSKEQQKDDKIEKRDRDDAVPLEKLAKDEKPLIVAELARMRADKAKQELTEAADGSIEQTAAIPVVEFDEALQQNLDEGQTFEEALEHAEESALDLIGAEAEAEVDEAGADEATSEDAGDDLDDQASTATPTVAVSTTGTPSGTSSGSGGVGSSALPISWASPAGAGAAGNAGTGGSAGSGGASPMGPGIAPGGMSPNVAPVASANTAPTVIVEREPVAPYVLAGGLVGYLIGRRRGRIKTEKKLIPIQKKLERQVEGLEKQIMQKEDRIRTLAREQAEKQPDLQMMMAERKVAQAKNKPEAVVAKQVVASEKLGKLAFKTETTRTSAEQTKSVDLMTVTELLVIAERIKLENSDVKRLFETNRLDDAGLRRVIRAYLRGERYDKVINENLKAPETKQFEIDPLQQRSQQSSSSQPSAMGDDRSQHAGASAYNQDNATQAVQNPNQFTGSDTSPQNKATKASPKHAARTTGIVTGVVVVLILIAALIFVR